MRSRGKHFIIRQLSLALCWVSSLGLEVAAQTDSEMKVGGGSDHAIEGSTSVLRDPFWPVGYTPAWVLEQAKPKEKKVQVGIDWSLAMKQVSIKGISSRSGSDCFAVINGQVKCMGETVSVQSNGLLYTWMIDSITPPNSVKLKRVSAQ